MENGKTYSGASAVNEMASDFSADVLTPQLLKPALTKVKQRMSFSYRIRVVLECQDCLSNARVFLSVA